MIVVTEKKSKGSLKREASGWIPSSKNELALAIRKQQTRRVNIFLVGPDYYWIEGGRFIGKNQGINYWMNRDEFICGFDVRTVSDRIEMIDDSLWSFHIGRQEVQLTFN
jgi:hypothetical protein